MFEYSRLESLEKKSEEAEETKTKLELAVELEKTKATSVQENNDRLNQTLADLNVWYLLIVIPLSEIIFICPVEIFLD